MSQESTSKSPINSSTTFTFRSEHGHALISDIVKMYAPFQPHDYVLEGIAALLDGLDLIAVTPTGSGKTGYIAFTTLVVRELTSHPENYPEIEEIIKRFPTVFFSTFGSRRCWGRECRLSGTQNRA
ncbi:hypothetical protein FB446DRAFT_719716 [Lentinula raphanica]|nr:hypothetical protein FB446DRAFT_719716 [Lentinula raphanica]